MGTFISQVVIAILVLALIGLVLMLILRKRKDKTHFQSKIVNDTSYNIAGQENTENADPEKVEEYLDRKNKEGGEPLNEGDFEAYNDKV